MKIALVNATDSGGGAAIACTRLGEALVAQGHEVNILVQKSKGEGHPLATPILKSKFQKIPYLLRGKKQDKLLSQYPKRETLFSVPLGLGKVHKNPVIQNADVIHLHWINDGFLSLDDIKAIADLGKPVFVTMHDMWYFTGGCHYTGGCENYKTHCGTCPVLGSKDEEDISYKVFEEKLKKLAGANIIYITPSNWLAEIAQSSKILSSRKVINIPNCIDISVFKPIDKSEALSNWGIDYDESKKYLLFGAVGAVEDERKGFKYLVEALNKLPKSENIELLVFGSKEVKIDLPFKVHNLGWIGSQAEMIKAYNAADVFITPSLQDNLPNTIMEAMACGTPCVGFETGGIPEMIDHLKNGYIAKQRDTDDMATGILDVLNNNYSVACLSKVDDSYTYQVVANQIISLYKG